MDHPTNQGHIACMPAKSERRCDLEVVARGERSLFGIFGPLAHPISSCRFLMKFVPSCARQCWYIPIVRGKCGLREAQPLTLFLAPEPHPVCSWPWLIPPARDRTRWKSTSRLLGRQHWALPTRRTPSSTVCGSHGAAVSVRASEWEDVSETSSSTSTSEHREDLQFVPCSRLRGPGSD